jgi:peptidoglycan hydrolase-like protein with peptidoglycan-binding domain
MNILHNKKLLVSVSVSTMLIGIMGGTALAQTTSYNEVHLGSRGQDVVRLQAALEGKSFLILNGAKKGYFGNLTLDALRSFQRSQGLNVSGIADQDTWEKIKTNNGMPDNMMSVDTNTKAASLRVLLNSINREHANLASIALRKGFDGAADFDASFKALDNNSVEIGKSIGAVYGAAAETTLPTL